MSVLFVMPSWSAPSELWMHRMIEAIAPHIGCIAAYNVTEPTWRGRIPALDLINHDEAPEILAEAVRSPQVSRILIHYLPFALRFERVWARTDKPLFVHCHGYDVTWNLHRHDPPHPPQFEPDYPKRVRTLAERATLIANSHFTAARLREIGVPGHRIAVKHLGVPVPNEPPQRSRTDESMRILFLGRLVDFKGPDLTLQAFELACRQGLEGKLIIAGDGPMRDALHNARSQSDFADRITLTGEVDAHTGARLRIHADVFSAHNRTGPISNQVEAFGVSFVEAMAAGLPIVTGRSGSLPEIVTHEREGLLIEPGNVEAHARALLHLYRDAELRRQMGLAAWCRARRCYSTQLEQARLLDILDLPATRTIVRAAS